MIPLKTAPSRRNWKSDEMVIIKEMRIAQDRARAEQKPQQSMSSTVGYVNHLGVKG